MKQKIVLYQLLVLLLFNFSHSKKVISCKNKNNNKGIINLPTNGTINYDIYCLKDSRDHCNIIEHEFNMAIKKIFLMFFGDFAEPANLDIIVDDYSKYGIVEPVIALNTKFEPIDPEIKEKLKKYPNYRTIKKTINRSKNDFILLFNNLSNVDLDLMSAQYTAYIIKQFVYGADLKAQDKVFAGLAYNEVKYGKPGWSKENYNNTLLFKSDDKLHYSKGGFKRIVAVGDIHGDYEGLVEILTKAKLIDKKKNWIGYNSIFVQLGDLHDKGHDAKKIFDLLIKIKSQAKVKGGKVKLLLGNHDISNLSGDFLCTYLSDLESFGSIEKKRKAYALGTKYGNLFRKDMDSIIVIDDIIFVHAGLRAEFATLGIDNINNSLHELLMNTPYNDDVCQTSPLFGEEGIFLTEFLENPNEEVCEEITKVLEMTNTKRMVVGHTPQEDGKIKNLCDNKLIMTDIGITDYYGSRFGYLEIRRDTNEYWAIYN